MLAGLMRYLAIFAVALLATTGHAALNVTPLSIGELITQATHPEPRYNSFRQEESEIDWYSWSLLFEVDENSGLQGNSRFRITVPDNYASDYSPIGANSGLRILNSSGAVINTFWDGPGSRTINLPGDYTELEWEYDGPSSGFDPAGTLAPDNPLTIEYLAQSPLIGGLHEMGFTVLVGGDPNPGDWFNYIHTPVPVAALSPIPEPAACALLLGAGVLCLALSRRRAD